MAGAVLWAVVRGQPMLHEHVDVADALSLRHGLKQLHILSNPQMVIRKAKIWA